MVVKQVLLDVDGRRWQGKSLRPGRTDGNGSQLRSAVEEGCGNLGNNVLAHIVGHVRVQSTKLISDLTVQLFQDLGDSFVYLGEFGDIGPACLLHRLE